MIARTLTRLTRTRLPIRCASTQSDPSLQPLVDQIGKLTLLETASLVSMLKSTLNIADAVHVAAPVAQASAAAVEEVKEEKAQTAFKVTLAKFDAATKAKVITFNLGTFF
jgi:large subunit ribosomal protein L7/L12